MQLGWSALALIIVAAFVTWFWQDSLGAREAANIAALDACRQLGLQLLDGTVAFARLGLTRERGLELRRTYVFDYTATSIDRCQGFVVMVGRRVESVGYETSETQRPAPARPADIREGIVIEARPSNVIDFETNRRDRERDGA
jgi:hypothetical protein